MSLTANGVLIPEDAANALTVNGVDITEVWANGVSVWQQQLFAAQWSGNSLTPDSRGMQVSGSSFRVMNDSSTVGAWLSANINGTFQNGQSITFIGLHSGGNQSTAVNGIKTSWFTQNYYSTDQIYFSIANGFTGSCTGTLAIETSGGLMRCVLGTAVGAWVSLT